MEERNGTPPPSPNTRLGQAGLSDRHIDVLLDALKLALHEPGEHRLFKAGKLTGLFPSRVGVSGEAATYALEQGYFETVRTESRGKAVIEWVRLTPVGVDFLYAHDSPKAILRELRDVLGGARADAPAWLGAMAKEFQAFTERCAEKIDRLTRQLDALTERVEQALRRADTGPPELPESTANLVPWAAEALGYLDRRHEGGATGDCPLPELFAALRRERPDLSMTAFHDGLRRLADVRAVRLSPCNGEDLHEPEYALLDGAKMLYYASR